MKKKPILFGFIAFILLFATACSSSNNDTNDEESARAKAEIGRAHV